MRVLLIGANGYMGPMSSRSLRPVTVYGSPMSSRLRRRSEGNMATRVPGIGRDFSGTSPRGGAGRRRHCQSVGRAGRPRLAFTSTRGDVTT